MRDNAFLPRRLAGALAAAAFFVLPSAAQGQTPPVRLSVEREEPSISHDLGLRRLKALAQCERPVTGGQYLGLTTATVRADFSYKVALRRVPDGVVGGVASLDIDLTLGNRRIFIASELPAGSCSFKETLAHEQRHVAIDDALLDQFKTRIRDSLGDEARRLSRLSAPSQEALTGQIYHRLERLLDGEMRAMRLTRLDRHAAFDSTEEYENLAQACDGETEAIVRAVEARSPAWHEPVNCAMLEEEAQAAAFP